ncbi:MAG: nuclear transport factor 2 family protein [Actinomycetota bacterium]|nr:nuclear transport factor 2 family protein [Actinomycetota bacterium]
MTDPRPELIRKAVEAFNDQDVPGLLALIHPDVQSRVAEGLGNPGTFSGIDGYLSMMAEWGEAWSENHIELEEVELVDESAVLVHTRQTVVGAGSGVPVTFGTVFLVAFEGERAKRFEIHPNRESAASAL